MTIADFLSITLIAKPRPWQCAHVYIYFSQKFCERIIRYRGFTRYNGNLSDVEPTVVFICGNLAKNVAS